MVYSGCFERSECKNVYKDCFTCRSHFADRSCGWCKQEGENKCYYGHYDGPYNGDCDKSHWVYGAESLGCDHSPAPRHSPTPTKHNNNSKGVKYLIIGFSIGGVLLVIVFVAIGIFVHRRNTKGGYQFVGDFVRAEDNFWDEQNSDSETDIDPNNNKDDNDNFDTEQILDVQIDSDNEEEDENENEEDSDNSSNSGSNSNSQSSLSSSYSSSEYQNENNPFKVGKISDENL
ncbi:32 kda heat shock protein-related [Anaeramoeba flamelloides]|uniref:32 kDa heat shock protein-related n=1 Tax=Anaeramoeba flamelloides TaxID=1746091 RepID=A0ABQ8YPI1_9EUKA|nr:32 kda heat shock protein-related [Anaeramoeba flamelloides]